jgi:AFG3 family protein
LVENGIVILQTFAFIPGDFKNNRKRLKRQMEDNSQKPGPKPGNETPGQRKGPKFNIYWIYGIILLAILGAQLIGGSFGSSSNEYTFENLRQALAKGAIRKGTVFCKQQR